MLDNHYQYPADALQNLSLDFWREIKDLFDIDNIFLYYYTSYLRAKISEDGNDVQYLTFKEYMQEQYPHLKELWNKL